MDLCSDWDLFERHLPISKVADAEVQIMPEPTDIYISTKTIISFLDRKVDLPSIFWSIHVIPYNTMCEGVVKKQMKFNSTSSEEVSCIEQIVAECNYA